MAEVIGYDRAWYLRKSAEPGYLEMRRFQQLRYLLRKKMGMTEYVDYYLFALDALELMRHDAIDQELEALK